MKRRSSAVWGLGVVGLGALLAGSRFTSPIKDIPSGTGYSAWELCTRSLHSGQPFDRVRSDYLEPKVKTLPQIWILDRGADRIAVSTRLPTLEHPRAALFREGLGCTLVPPDANEAAVRAQPFRAAPASAPSPASWPLGEGAAESPLLDPARRAVVDRHAAGLFGAPKAPGERALNTIALLVAERGHLVYERYAPGYERDRPQLGWSMTKSLTALIAGLLAHDGKLQLDSEVGLPQWAGSDKQAITWRQLLNMAPGLRWDEGYGGASDATEMLFSHADQGGFAAGQPKVAAPGAVFNYSTGTSNIAMLRLRQLVGGGHQAIYDYYQSRLFAPLGFRSGVIEPDASGTPVGGARGMLRPVDWLRLGQLVLNGGTWNGQRLLDPDYVEFLKAASPAEAGYGGSLWRQPSHHLPAALRGRLPADLIFFAGHMGQFVVIVPSRQLLLLRMGVSFDDDAATRRTFALVADLLTDR